MNLADDLEGLIAWEYDQRNSKVETQEIGWYLKHARITGSPVLELACGTGRLLLPIAEAGYTIDGVDVSNGMLERLNEKLSKLPIRARERVKTFCCDMMDFQFSKTYSMIFVGYNSLQYLGTKKRISGLLGNIFEALRPGGCFLAMTYHRNPNWYSEGKQRVIEKEPVVDKDRNLSVSHRTIETLNERSKIVFRKTIHEIRYERTTRTITETSQVPLLMRSDYTDMIKDAGFSVSTYGSYEEQGLPCRAKLACHVALKDANC